MWLRHRLPNAAAKQLVQDLSSVFHLPRSDGAPQSLKAIEARSSDCLYAYGFRFYFTPLTGVLFAFPSRYWFTIGQQGVFSLGGWSPHVQTKFHVLRPTRFHDKFIFEYGAITLYGVTFQTLLLTNRKLKGYSPFARRY